MSGLSQWWFLFQCFLVFFPCEWAILSHFFDSFVIFGDYWRLRSLLWDLWTSILTYNSQMLMTSAARKLRYLPASDLKECAATPGWRPLLRTVSSICDFSKVTLQGMLPLLYRVIFESCFWERRRWAGLRRGYCWSRIVNREGLARRAGRRTALESGFSVGGDLMQDMECPCWWEGGISGRWRRGRAGGGGWG